MRADFSGLPVSQARVKSAIVSAGVFTSRITVFMVPPRNVKLKVGHQLVRRRKHVRVLISTKMAMVTFACLVVVAHDACPAHHIRQPVLECVQRARNRFRKPPEYQFSKGGLGISNPSAD